MIDFVAWAAMERYSLFEVLFMILLAALPMSRIAEVFLGMLTAKTGINVGHNHEQKDNQNR